MPASQPFLFELSFPISQRPVATGAAQPPRFGRFRGDLAVSGGGRAGMGLLPNYAAWASTASCLHFSVFGVSVSSRFLAAGRDTGLTFRVFSAARASERCQNSGPLGFGGFV